MRPSAATPAGQNKSSGQIHISAMDSSGSAVTLTLPLTQSGGKVYDAGADSIEIFAEILGE